jgi:hypothetical protein
MAITCVTVPLGPACVNVTGVRAGDRNEMTFTLTSKGTPIDLTGMAVTAMARKKATDADPAVTAEVTITDPVNGQGFLRWPGAEVATSMAGKAEWIGVWDMQIDDGATDPVTVAAGGFTATMDVTR